jgi:hypothetical protein
VSELLCPKPWVWCVFGLLVILTVAWTWFAPRTTLAILGTALIGMSYVLVYSARTQWDYEELVGWSRYHLLPHLGLVFLILGGLRLPRSRFAGPARQGLSWRKGCSILLLIGTLFVLQLPRGVLAHVRWPKEDESGEFVSTLPGGTRLRWEDAEVHAEQLRVLQRIEAVDALCREHHISAADARRCLDPIRMAYDAAGKPQNESNWQFLHGSDNPREHSDEEIRRFLQPANPD